jgi:hypothetical protein
MIDYESGDMSDRFRTDPVSTAVFGARANHNQICLPFGCRIHDFALGAALSLERFCTGELAQPFIKDILGRRYFGPAHLFLAWGGGPVGARNAREGAQYHVAGRDRSHR